MMLVAVVLPGGDFFFEGRLVWNAAAQTLARQDAEFGFGHVDRVVAGLLDDVQFDDLLLEQAQTPTREPLGSRRAGQSDQFRLGGSVENPRPGGVRIVFAGQRRLEAFLDSRRRVRPILLMLVSNAADIALSLQPS